MWNFRFWYDLITGDFIKGHTWTVRTAKGRWWPCDTRTERQEQPVRLTHSRRAAVKRLSSSVRLVKLWGLHTNTPHWGHILLCPGRNLRLAHASIRGKDISKQIPDPSTMGCGGFRRICNGSVFSWSATLNWMMVLDTKAISKVCLGIRGNQRGCF